MQMQAQLLPRLEQRMKLAPQIIQSIEILQLPTLALQQRVQQELEINPVLETELDSEEAQEKAELEAEEMQEREDDAQDTDEFEKYEEMAEDWWEFQADTMPTRRRSDGEDEKLEAIQNTPAPSMSLHDYLLNQLMLMDVEDDVAEACEYIIFNIDPNGYLAYPLEEIVESMDEPCSMEIAEQSLRIVQTMEPPGVGARTLEECLLLQVSATEPHFELVRNLIGNHLKDIEMNRYPQIAKETGRSIEEVKEAVDFIRTLNPRPGNVFSNEPTHYITPDVIVQYMDGKYEVLLEDKNLPRLYISPYYRQLLRKEKAGSRAREFVKQKFASARWLIDAIEQRRSTLYKVASNIVEFQQDFFEHGTSHLKPLKMQEVADAIGMHVSTVSRAIANKYMQSPQGLHELRAFFTGGTMGQDGHMESWKSIRQKIIEMIENEDKSKPLSDDEIAKRFKRQGLDVARRTVTKYRQALRIPSSRQRKQY